MKQATSDEDSDQLPLMPQRPEQNERKETDDKRKLKNILFLFRRPGLIWAMSAGIANTGHVVLLSKVAHASNPMQSLFTKCAFLLSFVFLISWKDSNVYDCRDLVINIMYGFFETLGSGAGVAAMVLSSTADVTAIMYNKAIPAAILARILIGESIDIIDGALIIINGTGLVLICKLSVDEAESDTTSSTLGILLAFCGMFFLSLLYTLVRCLTFRNTADPSLLAFMAGCIGIIFSSTFLTLTNSWMFPDTGSDIFLFICLGGISLYGFYSFLRALKTENTCIVASSLTISIPLTYCYEAIFEKRIVAWQTILGIFFTIGSTLLLHAKSFLRGDDTS